MLDILYEDNHLIAINKAPKEITQGDRTGDRPISDKIKEYLRIKYDKPGEAFLGVIHRLDRPTSGVIIYAKTSKGLTRMNALFKKHEVRKIYHAIVAPPPKHHEGTIVHYLKKNNQQNKSYVTSSNTPGAKEAKLKYKVIGQSLRYTLCEIELMTGRHHQIRAQMSAIGAVIRGDLKYGAKRSLPNASISLHARELSFVHPISKKNITIEAPYPTDDSLWLQFEDIEKKKATY